MSMTISIVTACFNCASTLQTALASVAAQKGVSIDYIVVDGASTDGTVEMLKAFQENLAASSRDDLSFRFISERDEGMYDAINKGIKIHRISCPNASRLISLYPYRIQRVKWQDTQSSGEFLTTLSIFAVPDGSNMGAIVDIIARFRVSLRSVSVRPKANRDGDDEITVKLLVPSNSELDKVISQIGRLGQVRKVRRV